MRRKKHISTSAHQHTGMTLVKKIGVIILMCLLSSCSKESEKQPIDEKPDDVSGPLVYPGVPLSDIYEVTLIRGNLKEKVAVFQNTCPTFELGKMNMMDKDQFPLDIFAGRSISWGHFSFSGSITVEVKVNNTTKVPVTGTVKVLPSRYGIIPTVAGNVIRFTLTTPGQYSIEIGQNGYKNGLMIFADPPETDIPASTQYALLNNATQTTINGVSSSVSGIWFKSGVHNIGVYHVPANIKNIYFEKGSWVYGSLIMDGKPNVKIFGRGVLSSGKLNYRESHCIEAINQSNNIHVEGIVVADPKYFSIRLIGENNTVKWTKVIGGWIYNCDGISAFAGSNVSNCFIWANDDAIKVYRDNITWSDIVVWQLNNGGVIQMAWGGSLAKNVHISKVDVLHAEWNKPGFNRALLSCVGNKYEEPGRYGEQMDWIIEDVVTENPIPIIFNVTPNPFTYNHIHNLTLKNWNVKMTMNTEYQNMIIGNDPSEYFDGFVFDNFTFNGIKLSQTNWLETTGLIHENLVTPVVK